MRFKKPLLIGLPIVGAIIALFNQPRFRRYIRDNFGTGRDNVIHVVNTAQKKSRAAIKRVRPAAKTFAENATKRAEKFFAKKNVKL